MKLTLSIATAFSGFAYLIVKNVALDFPITSEQFLEVFLWLLGVLGVVLVEAKTRAELVKRGFTGFIAD